ncbi:hypothetical protein MRX96_009522 [Rhipicephalus microplus]
MMPRARSFSRSEEEDPEQTMRSRRRREYFSEQTTRSRRRDATTPAGVSSSLRFSLYRKKLSPFSCCFATASSGPLCNNATLERSLFPHSQLLPSITSSSAPAVRNE